jgi:hypothetical protein
MKKWILLLSLFSVLTSWSQYTYTYTDPCTLALKSVFVPAGGGVTVNYFNNNNVFTSNDFSSGVFDAWITQVSQQNSNSPCQSVTTTVVNTVSTAIISNTVGIVVNVVAISSLASSMADISSSIGSSMSATAGGVSNMSTGNSVDNNSNSNDKPNSNTSTGANTGTTGTGSTGNSSQTSQTPSSTSGGASTQPSTGTPQQGGSTTSPNQPTSTGSSTSESSVGTDSGSSSSGNTANSVSNSIDGGSGEGGGSSSGGGSSNSKKQANAKASTGSLIASGDMVVISPTDSAEKNQYKFVGSITHANTKGTRIKGVLFNFTTGANNINVTFYKSWINKSRSLNTIVANSTMMDFEKNLFNTTTALESYKLSKKLTSMFGMNFTLGKMGERNFYNISAVGGGHGSFNVSKRVSTSILALVIYSPFTQFYEGKWWDAGILVVPFNSWDFKITKTFKYNVSATAVYSYGDNFLNYQILTGGKISF